MRRYSVSVHSIGTNNEKKEVRGGNFTGGGGGEDRNQDFHCISSHSICRHGVAAVIVLRLRELFL